MHSRQRDVAQDCTAQAAAGAASAGAAETGLMDLPRELRDEIYDCAGFSLELQGSADCVLAINPDWRPPCAFSITVTNQELSTHRYFEHTASHIEVLEQLERNTPSAEEKASQLAVPRFHPLLQINRQIRHEFLEHINSRRAMSTEITVKVRDFDYSRLTRLVKTGRCPRRIFINLIGGSSENSGQLFAEWMEDNMVDWSEYGYDVNYKKTDYYQDYPSWDLESRLDGWSLGEIGGVDIIEVLLDPRLPELPMNAVNQAWDHCTAIAEHMKAIRNRIRNADEWQRYLLISFANGGDVQPGILWRLRELGYYNSRPVLTCGQGDMTV